MPRTYVIYYPPTTSHPFLVVTFLADGTPKVLSFGKEKEAEAFVARANPPRKPRHVSPS
jgi:hypothetical protein